MLLRVALNTLILNPISINRVHESAYGFGGRSKKNVIPY